MRRLLQYIFSHMAQRAVDKAIKELRDPATTDEFLLSVLRENQDSMFGKKHGFAEISTVDEFRERVPLFTHADMAPYLQACLADPTACTLTHDHIFWFALTSGTSGNPKRLPLTRRGLYASQRVMGLPIMGYVHYTSDTSPVGPLLLIGSLPRVTEVQGVPVGWLSGVSRVIAGGFMRRNMHPPFELFEIRDSQERMWRFMLHAVAIKRLGSMGGLPLSELMFLREVRRSTDRLIAHFEGTDTARQLRDARDDQGLLDIAQLWPNLRILMGAGLSMRPYLQYMHQTFPTVTYLETYSGSEGTFAAQIDPDDTMYLASHVNYFEFIPLEKRHLPSPPVLSLSQVRAGERYEVVLTNLFGWTRLRLGDIVTVTATNPVRITNVSRITTTTTVAGAQLTNIQVEDAVTEMTERSHVPLVDFTLVAANSQRQYVLIMLVDDPSHVDLSEVAVLLDLALSKQSVSYHDARESEALRPPAVMLTARSMFLDRTHDSIFQVKPIVLTDDEGFLRKYSSGVVAGA
ncbi:MAG: GH3 auxin-responsive promoter family protein [Candidatus Thorarchaeota archaeon]|nr:GH3 auxin-responsive promoter family protein [Candidatus Thorarchaeota archaeon]